ncbi:MAG: C40 family peptidase [Lachnospiraceae bacterium]|nr:C40 family peptidase [Lachnospiraceae bacterium]
MNKKKLLSMLLILSVMTALPQNVIRAFATSAQEKRDQAQQGLDSVQQQIDQISGQQQQVENSLSSAEVQLASLLAAQEALQVEIDNTNAAIEQTRIELAAAKQQEQEEYESMKLRIQYMYENSSNDSIWSVILEADGFVDMLNRVEYAAEVYRYDRTMLEQYKQTVQLVKEREQQLDEEMNELLGQQESYLGQQAEIEELIASLEGAQARYAAQLAEAQKKVDEYTRVINEQDEIIRKQQEEEERRRQEEEQRKKEEEEKQRQQAQQQQTQQQEQTQEQTTQESDTPATDNTTTTSGNGASVVSYANQFVGNPYVWGGNSLTTGCDCSGFVNLVYAHYGYSLPRYSLSFLNVGTPVSIENIQPGDIVVYDKVNGVGHVAIYAGNGKIVEAQSSSAGITNTRSVNCRTILGIRRVIN